MDGTDPTALTNIIGVGGCDVLASDNMFLIWNDGLGTASSLDLGSNYTMSTATSTPFFQLELFAPPNGTGVYYRIMKLNDTSLAPTVGFLNRPVHRRNVLRPSAGNSLGLFVGGREWSRWATKGS